MNSTLRARIVCHRSYSVPPIEHEVDDRLLAPRRVDSYVAIGAFG